MTRLKKSVHFEVVHKHGSGPVQYDIVVVHPFYSKRRDTEGFKDAFGELRTALTDNTVVRDASNVYLFSFKYKKIVSGKVPIKEVSNELLSHLGKQREILRITSHKAAESRSNAPVVAHSSSMSETQEIGEGTEGVDYSIQPYLLFISHSLASWVVKAALSQNKQPNVSVFKTQGIIFLDNMIGTSEDSYTQYVDSLYQNVFTRHKANAKNGPDTRNELSQSLKKIDESYKTWVDAVKVREWRRRDRLPSIIPDDSHPLWLRKANMGVVDQETQGGKSALLRKYSRIITVSRKSVTDEHEQRRSALASLNLQDRVTAYVKQKNLHESESTSIPVRSDSPMSNSPQSSQANSPLECQNSTPEDRSNRRQSTTSNFSIVYSNSGHKSNGSVPNFPPLQSGSSNDDLNLRRNIDMGKTFIRKGELGNAETAFQRASAILDTTNLKDSTGYMSEIKVQLASIALFRGKYEEAQMEFEKLLLSHGDQGAARRDVAAVIRRWIGIALLYQGKYGSAVEQFRLLLDKFSADCKEEEAQIRRDLALAYAYLGNFDKAFTELGRACQCLDTSETLQPEDQRSSKEYRVTRIDATNTSSGQVMLVALPVMNESETSSSAKSYKSISRSIEWEAKRDVLYFAEAKIKLIWGDFEPALRDSERALRGMTKRLGPKHLKTLECASLNALLLALNSQMEEAESACNATYRVMSTELGPEHPLTLEAIGHLIQIYQMQSRFLEAVETARSLNRIVKSFQKERAPYILQARCLYAESELKIGNFYTANEELIDIGKDSQLEHNENLPETLRYKTLLALAHHHCAENDEAEVDARGVLRKQLKIYIRRQNSACDKIRVDENDLKKRAEMMEKIASNSLLPLLIAMLITGPLVLEIQPPLLKTLRVISLILQQKEDKESISLATKILQAIWGRCKHQAKEESYQALQVRYDLALAIRREAEAEADAENNAARSQQLLQNSRDHLRNVHRVMSRILGPEHPETLSAKREFIITNCSLGKWEVTKDFEPDSDQSGCQSPSEGNNDSDLNTKTWNLVHNQCRTIAHLHEAQLGENHPETLMSLLWLLKMQMLLSDDKTAIETLNKILTRLKDVPQQHLVDSIIREYKLALLVANDKSQRSKDILTKLMKSMRINPSKLSEGGSMLEKMGHEAIRRSRAVSG